MARIIKNAENLDAREHEKLRRARIIDKATFNAQLLAREMLDKAQINERAKLELALKNADEIEAQACQNAIDSARKACLLDLTHTFRELDALLKAGEREVQELSREIIYKIVGDGIEVLEDNFGLTERKLRIEASLGDFNKLKMFHLPSWVEPSESARTVPGKLIIETETFMIQCSLEELMTAMDLSVQDG